MTFHSAVVFGAGSIGRGFIGQLFAESGMEVVFVEVDREIVDQLNESRAYPVRIVDNRKQRETNVEPVRAIHGSDIDAVADAVSQAQVVATAVGARILPHIAPAVARGIRQRAERRANCLNVILCENHATADKILRDEVVGLLPDMRSVDVDSATGFIRASIGRMVPAVTDEMRGDNPLRVWAEPYNKLPVDAEGVRGSLPAIPGLQLSAPFEFEIDKKLFLHNMTHAIAAYFGQRAGYTYIWEAVANRQIRRRVQDAGSLVSRALAFEYSKPERPIHAYTEELLRRYENRALGDTVERVGRDPERKLGPADRFIGAAKLCAKHSLPVKPIAEGCAAAIAVGAEAGGIGEALRHGGVTAVIELVCGLENTDPVAVAIARAAESIH